MERRVDISDSLSRTRLFPALLVMARDTGVVVGTSFDPSQIKKKPVIEIQNIASNEEWIKFLA